MAAIMAAHHGSGSLLVIRNSVEIPLHSSTVQLVETRACRSTWV
ncbi:hypothetical protein PDR5_45190 [Pseudomonas sp. DR 5-09]|nr:hypothetical protein PDR5_45190 [Pseudomonas sp. DR 5-09]